MIMKKILYCLTVVSLFLISCKRDSDITAVVHEIDYKNKTQDVISGRFIDEIVGASNIVVFDTLIMVHTLNPDGQLLVYSSNTLELLGSFCKKGRAKNEFIRASVATEQAYYRNGHVILVVFDVPDTFKEVDITESIKKGVTVVVSTEQCSSMANSEMMVLGNNYASRYEFVRNIYDGDEYSEDITKVPTRYSVYKNGKKKDLKFFRKIMNSDVQNKTLPYIGSLYKHPERNLVVQSFQRMDYLLFMDFDRNDFFAIHQTGSLSFKDNFKYKEDSNTALFFTDGASSSDYLMILYRQGDYTLKETAGNWLPELLVFDWDGNYITGFKLDRKVRSIEYDEKHKVLYALGGPTWESLYAYDLDQYIQ